MIRVTVVKYDDRYDPAPPFNYRVEIAIGKHTFIPIAAAYEPNAGCMTQEQAQVLGVSVT